MGSDVACCAGFEDFEAYDLRVRTVRPRLDGR